MVSPPGKWLRYTGYNNSNGRSPNSSNNSIQFSTRKSDYDNIFSIRRWTVADGLEAKNAGGFTSQLISKLQDYESAEHLRIGERYSSYGYNLTLPINKNKMRITFDLECLGTESAQVCYILLFPFVLFYCFFWLFSYGL